MVAVVLGLPAKVVAVWSQSGDPTAGSDPVTGPLTSGFGGAPRGIRTPNRQIRSQPPLAPARPSGPFASLLVLVRGHVASWSRASVPVCHAWRGRNVVAVSGWRRQTGCLVTRRVLAAIGEVERQILDLALTPLPSQPWCSARIAPGKYGTPTPLRSDAASAPNSSRSRRSWPRCPPVPKGPTPAGSRMPRAMLQRRGGSGANADARGAPAFTW